MRKMYIIDTCLKCGHEWFRDFIKYKRCISCKCSNWDQYPVKKNVKKPLKIDVPVGVSKMYPFDKRTKTAITNAKKKNPWLVADVRGDVVIVRNDKP
jgi:hypothetical protein